MFVCRMARQGGSLLVLSAFCILSTFAQGLLCYKYYIIIAGDSSDDHIPFLQLTYILPHRYLTAWLIQNLLFSPDLVFELQERLGMYLVFQLGEANYRSNIHFYHLHGCCLQSKNECYCNKRFTIILLHDYQDKPQNNQAEQIIDLTHY